jgi:hypothetical protein
MEFEQAEESRQTRQQEGRRKRPKPAPSQRDHQAKRVEGNGQRSSSRSAGGGRRLGAGQRLRVGFAIGYGLNHKAGANRLGTEEDRARR